MTLMLQGRTPGKLGKSVQKHLSHVGHRLPDALLYSVSHAELQAQHREKFERRTTSRVTHDTRCQQEALLYCGL